jgi:phenylalanyl-tRNA synthetase beta chain
VAIGVAPVDAAKRPYLIPGRSAELTVDGQSVGYLGELHPLVAKAFDMSGATAAEFDIDALARSLPEAATYEPISSFPPAREDIAVVVPRDVPAEDILNVVREAAGDLLVDARVFDVYEGEQVGEGKKSLAIRLTYSAPDRTLTDDETATARAAITEKLAKVGGSLRA